MSWTEDELLEAFRAERGPGPAARARLERRMAEVTNAADESTETAPREEEPSGPRWLRRAGIAAVALAAAAIGTCALAPQRGTEVERQDAASLVPNAARGKAVAGTVQGAPPPSTPHAAKPPTDADAAPPPPAATDPAPAPAEQEAPRPEPKASTRKRGSHAPRASRPPEPPPRPPATSLAEEAAAIGRARAALAQGQPAKALALIDAYRTRFPHPALGEEAEAVAAMSRCHGASPEVARASATAFAKAHPRSLFKKQVARSCTPTEKKVEPTQRPSAPVDIHEQE